MRPVESWLVLEREPVYFTTDLPSVNPAGAGPPTGSGWGIPSLSIRV